MKKPFRLFPLFLLLLLLLASCDALPASLQPSASGGGGSGFLGDTMSSVFFDFTVTDAFSCKSYEGYTAAEDWTLIVATLTVQNTYTQTLPMGYYDFQIQWGEGDEDYDYPLAVFCDAQFPDEYELLINESRTGVLVYEVPADTQDYSVSYLEVYDNDETGDVYFVYFSAPYEERTGDAV